MVMIRSHAGEPSTALTIKIWYQVLEYSGQCLYEKFRKTPTSQPTNAENGKESSSYRECEEYSKI